MKGWFWRPIDIASLVFFRVVFGVLGFADLMGGWTYYHLWMGAFEPEKYQFTYYGFGWVTVFSEPLMSLFFIVGMGLAIAVALGWRYRFTAPLFACFFTYYFLLEKTNYLNHAYLFCWISWIMALLPAWREWSLDVKRQPRERSSTIPRWCLFVLLFSMGTVYFFGGLAKLNPDWMYHAMPLQLWLRAKADLFLIGPLVAKETTAWIMAWGGAVFDLSIVFLMLYRPTRILGFSLAVGFHLTNHLVFNIGIFPYLSIALTALFFSPSWPRSAVSFLAARIPRIAKWHTAWLDVVSTVEPQASRFWQQQKAYQNRIGLGLTIFISIHCFLPLRHHLFDSDVAWSEEGHRYAWRMMLRSKSGTGYYNVEEISTGIVERVYPRDSLSSKQARKLWTHPDMILQYAHHLRDQAKAEGLPVAVYAKVRVKLNGGKYHPYVDDTIDLAQQEWSFLETKRWVLPERKE
jgi:hypothetical protein